MRLLRWRICSWYQLDLFVLSCASHVQVRFLVYWVFVFYALFCTLVNSRRLLWNLVHRMVWLFIRCCTCLVLFTFHFVCVAVMYTSCLNTAGLASCLIKYSASMSAQYVYAVLITADDWRRSWLVHENILTATEMTTLNGIFVMILYIIHYFCVSNCTR